MEINVLMVLGIIVIHYIADFVFQTDEMAINKNKSNKWLLSHVAVYSFVWWFIGLFLFDVIKVIEFWAVTFICHFIIDYFTSRWSSKLYQKGERHNFFLVIGFDQVLHYFQLFLTYYILCK